MGGLLVVQLFHERLEQDSSDLAIAVAESRQHALQVWCCLWLCAEEGGEEEVHVLQTLAADEAAGGLQLCWGLRQLCVRLLAAVLLLVTMVVVGCVAVAVVLLLVRAVI